MLNITLLAIDIAKSVFQLHGLDAKGKCIFKKRVKREQLLKEISKLPKCTIAMEACGTSHYWARTFVELGFEVRLISPQYVKPFVKTNKNDRNDAAAIAEAASRPSMHFVSIKSEEKQVVQAIHRRRSLQVKQRTALINQIRGLLAEFGICVPAKVSSVGKTLVEYMDEELHPNVSPKLRLLCEDMYEELNLLNEKVKRYDKLINQVVVENPLIQEIMKLDGVGAIGATMTWVSIGDNPFVYKNGRQYSASVGLAPRQHSSGDKVKLGSISKRGDKYLRQLLIHGARTVVWRSSKDDTKSSEWVRNLVARRGFNIAVVAVANKTARNIWRTVADFCNENSLSACQA
jgi:transposase